MDLPQSTLILFAYILLVVPFILGIIGFVIVFGTGQTGLSPRFSKWLGHGTVIGSIILLVLSSLMLATSADQYPLRFSISIVIIQVDFNIDALSLYFILLVNVIACFASWNAIHHVGDYFSENWLQHPAFFHASINLFHGTMLLVPMVDNLVGLWIAIEATTLVSALLVGYQNTKESWEAAWKYLIITSTGIILALLGTMFLANALPKGQIPIGSSGTPLDSVMNWTFLMQKAREGAFKSTSDFVALSFLFVLIGYGTKAGLAPMHTWLPDGHGEAPPPISALLSGVLLKSALYAILRFYTITNTVLGNTTFTSTVLLGSGLFSLLIATPFILKENRFKRVLAYHSLEHMGIITFGIGIGGPVALFGALLHIFNHAVTKSLMFLSFGNIMRQYEQLAKKEGREFDQKDITGVLRSMPWTGGILALGGLALVGTPPFNIFMSEFIILWGALSLSLQPLGAATSQIPQWAIIFAVVLFMLSTTLIFYGLVRHVARLVLHKLPNDQRLEERFRKDLLPLLLLSSLVLIFGLWVFPPISHIISQSVSIVLNN
jgi:hydrogenase-4 component F